jgi:hypothetical protein
VNASTAIALDVARPGDVPEIVSLGHRCNREHAEPRAHLSCALRVVVGADLPAEVRVHGGGRLAVVHLMLRREGELVRPVLRCWCTNHPDAAYREWADLLADDRPHHHGLGECVGVVRDIWRLPRLPRFEGVAP